MEIWLSKNNSDKIRLPINPSEIGSQFTTNFTDIVLSSGYEKTVLAGKNLKTTTVSSFFPKNPTYYMSEQDILEPMEYVKKIEDWMVMENNIVLLQVTGTNISRYVTIRDFQWSEQGGAVGDIDYTLELKEYQPVLYKIIGEAAGATKTEDKSKPGSSTSNRPASTANKPTSYTVKKGDSLWKISKAIYGTGNKIDTIYNANKKIIGPNKNLIQPGQKLVIPW